jgi:predicted Zn-ribbon and HTH transcriptional regulator
VGASSRLRGRRGWSLPRRRALEVHHLAVRRLARRKHCELTALLQEDFMREEHFLHCRCGENARMTLAAASDAGWEVATDRLSIVSSRCPRCAQHWTGY